MMKRIYDQQTIAGGEFPGRIYTWASTARGFNDWQDEPDILEITRDVARSG
jgi:hypothetical protein